ESHPVISLRVKEAVRRGAALVVIDPRPIELTQWATHWLQPLPGTNVAVLQGMMHHILSAGLTDQAFIESRTEGFAAFAASLSTCTPEWAAGLSGVPADLIREAAEVYARAGAATILYAMGVTQHTTGTDGVLTLANLAMLTGQIGRPSTGLNPLRGQNNVQGSSDMGALFDTLPGYRKVVDHASRTALAAAWGLSDLPAQPGVAASLIPDAILEGKVRALYLMGENIVLTDPDAGHTRKALTALPFLVVQDMFLTETAAYAHVVLPACSWAEKEGTFTNTERRVQRFYQALQPLGESRPDWQIIAGLSARLGYAMPYAGPEAVMAEIASCMPIYGGIRYDRLGEQGLQWPCPTPDHPGTPILHRERFTRGAGRFTAIDFRPSAELPDAEYPFIFTTGRSLFHYHGGSMTRRARPLAEHMPTAYAEMEPATAAAMGIADGDTVQITSRRGQVLVTAKLVEGTGPRVVFMPFHFREAAANVLTNTALDPVARIPELKVCAVRVEVANA
ncbi:MAG TPA: molybdopterin-dependent oxidoreductase, partial [Symbiobacteriaceae bacterium]|nr:molybdopterin-dependent oxidoreductase [Symbiobacteriaceae bacterium]